MSGSSSFYGGSSSADVAVATVRGATGRSSGVAAGGWVEGSAGAGSAAGAAARGSEAGAGAGATGRVGADACGSGFERDAAGAPAVEAVPADTGPEVDTPPETGRVAGAGCARA